MRDSSLGAEQLNQDKLNQEELDKALQELYIVREKLDKLDSPKNQKPIALSKYKNVKLSGELKDSKGINEDNIYEIEYDNKQKELYELRNEELILLATIDEKNYLKLSDYEKARYEEMTRERELDNPFEIDEEEMEKEKEFETSLDDEKDKEESKEEDKEGKNIDSETEDYARDAQIAKAIGVKDADSVLMVVEIKDELTMSRVLNKNVERTNLYAVKLKQDSDVMDFGSNDWVYVSENSKGEFNQTIDNEQSKVMRGLTDKLGLKNNNVQTADIDSGDIDSLGSSELIDIKTINAKVRINGTYLDDTDGVAQINHNAQIDMHTLKDGELICDDEHEHEEEKIELPDRDVEVKDNKSDRPKGGITPGDIAYENTYERQHKR